jgi:hypothetical protein
MARGADAVTAELTLLAELRRDLKRDFKDAEMSRAEARYIVDVYYQLQDFRIQAAGQLRSEAAEPRRWAETLLRAFELLEKDVQSVLGAWARRHPAGAWAQSITGVGPVLSAGLVAHIEIRRQREDPALPGAMIEEITRTAGQVWRFAGLDPTSRWEKGQKRPWNAKLKVLCWKLGDSFVKQSGRDSDVYGHIYRARKELEVARNEAGEFADQAAASLEARQIKDKALKATYESGRLPDGRIDLRARRYAVKLFLAHYHWVAYETEMGVPPEKPYIFTENALLAGYGIHNGFIMPPGWNGIAAKDESAIAVDRHIGIMQRKAANRRTDVKTPPINDPKCDHTVCSTCGRCTKCEGHGFPCNQ